MDSLTESRGQIKKIQTLPRRREVNDATSVSNEKKRKERLPDRSVHDSGQQNDILWVLNLNGKKNIISVWILLIKSIRSFFSLSTSSIYSHRKNGDETAVGSRAGEGSTFSRSMP